MSERYEGPHPPDYPLRGENQPDDREPVPVCPVCGALMRRGPIAWRHALVCDIHGIQLPVWMSHEDDAA